MASERRERWIRYGVAFALGGALLAMTYVLFDPDLGTPVPLFQEFTCLPHGKLQVSATDPAGGRHIHAPQMAVHLTAKGGGALRPAYLTAYVREGNGAWKEYLSVAVPSGENFMVISDITNATQIYASAKDLEGKYCYGRSDVISGAATSSAPSS